MSPRDPRAAAATARQPADALSLARPSKPGDTVSRPAALTPAPDKGGQPHRRFNALSMRP